jgi:transcriptional regulator
MLFEPSIGEHGVLFGHLARPNDQWRDARPAAEAIAIFNGPDAYISPSWYEEKQRTGRVVPTWNYTTVVVHGELIAHDERDWLVAHVRRLVDAHEQSRPAPWSVDDAPDGYIVGQAKGIVGLELVIGRIDAKRKLTQNRSDADVRGTIDGLEHGSAREQALAIDMRKATAD